MKQFEAGAGFAKNKKLTLETCSFLIDLWKLQKSCHLSCQTLNGWLTLIRQKLLSLLTITVTSTLILLTK